MNPQGNNNQQPQGNQAAPAGAWNAGIQINNAPPPLVLPAAQPVRLSWREQCREEGWAAGDENLQSYLQQQSLLADDGSFNSTLINAMTNRPGAPVGLRMALFTMAFLMDWRNFVLNELRRVRSLVDDVTQQFADARNPLLRSQTQGPRGESLTQLRDNYFALQARLAGLETELPALQAEAAEIQANVQQAQRHLLIMFRGHVPFAPLVDVNQYTRDDNVVVFPIPWPHDQFEMRGAHLVVRYPATFSIVIMSLMGMPMALLHPACQNTPEQPDRWEQTLVFFSMTYSLLLLLAHLRDRLFGRRQ